MRLSDEEFMDQAAISIMNGLISGRSGRISEEKMEQYVGIACGVSLLLAVQRRKTIALLEQLDKQGDA